MADPELVDIDDDGDLDLISLAGNLGGRPILSKHCNPGASNPAFIQEELEIQTQ